jgi:predicted AAA+ superfamily ATPase
LKRLYDLLKSRPLQNSVIIGPRRSGKTSLLLNLRNIAITAPEELRPDQRANQLP